MASRLRMIAGAPARHQIAMTMSNTKQPNDELGMNGQTGLPQKWCGRSHAACVSQTMPM